MSLTEILSLLLILSALIGCPAFVLWVADRWAKPPANSRPHPEGPHSHCNH